MAFYDLSASTLSANARSCLLVTLLMSLITVISIIISVVFALSFM